MGLTSSLFSGVSGLATLGNAMTVIGDNIDNVNTVGFKASRVTFEEGFAQLLQGASRPPGEGSDLSGGVNPVQVGLGMNIGSIDLVYTQGSLEATGLNTDLALEGDSFFVVNGGEGNVFTRSGTLHLRNAANAEDDRVIEADCDCEACRGFSRGYIRHLFNTGEMLGPILTSIHNLRFFQRFMSRIRDLLSVGKLARIVDEFPIAATAAPTPNGEETV